MWSSPVALVVKNPPTNTGGVRVEGSIPGSGRSLEKEMAAHSSILPWRIPWREEPGRLQSTELQRGRHDWNDWACTQCNLPVPLNQGPFQWPLVRTKMTFEHVFCILSMVTEILTPYVVLPKYLGNEHFRRLSIECFQFCFSGVLLQKLFVSHKGKKADLLSENLGFWIFAF